MAIYYDANAGFWRDSSKPWAMADQGALDPSDWNVGQGAINWRSPDEQFTNNPFSVTNYTGSAPWANNSANQFMSPVTGPDGKVYGFVSVDSGGLDPGNAPLTSDLSQIGQGNATYLMGKTFGGQQRAQGRGNVGLAKLGDQYGYLVSPTGGTEYDNADKNLSSLRNIISEVGPMVAAAIAGYGLTGGLSSLFGGSAAAGLAGLDAMGAGYGLTQGAVPGALAAGGANSAGGGMFDWLGNLWDSASNGISNLFSGGGATDPFGGLVGPMPDGGNLGDFVFQGPMSNGGNLGNWYNGTLGTSGPTSGILNTINNAARTTGQAAGGVNQITNLLGGNASLPLLGGLLGGLGSMGQRQAGTTTTVQDIPDWQKPFVINAMGQAGNALGDATAAYQATRPVIQGATNQLGKTIAGDYLNNNPYLDATFDQAANKVSNQVNSQFSLAGRYGSGAHTGALTEGLGNLATNLYGGNYQQERQRQFAGSLAAPSYSTGASSAAYGPVGGYSNIVGNRYGSTTSTPYYTNPLGGVASGLLGGYALSRGL